MGRRDRKTERQDERKEARGMVAGQLTEELRKEKGELSAKYNEMVAKWQNEKNSIGNFARAR